MNSKALLGFCITLAFISMPVAFLLNPTMNEPEPEFVGYKAEFVGQEVAEVGELVRFLAEGELVRWECLPKTSDSDSYGTNNENYVVSFRSPGIYTVIAAIYVQNELSIHSQAVTVEGAPVIVPDPIVPVPSPTVDVGLVNRVKTWVVKYQVPRDQSLSLARNFEAVQALISDGSLTTPGQIITKTAELNSDLKLNEGLMAELQAYLTSQSDVGNLTTAKDHILVWSSIAKGLKDAAI